MTRHFNCHTSVPSKRAGAAIFNPHSADPFLRVAFPLAGYDLYGGPGEIEVQEVSQPIAHLRLDQIGSVTALLPVSAQPIDGGVCAFALRAIGAADGYAESSWRWTRYRRVGNRLRVRPELPAWPRAAGWLPARREGGELRFAFAWARAAATALGESVTVTARLVAEDRAASSSVPVSALLGAAQRVWEVSTDAPAALPTRYRIELETSEGAIERGEWSMWVEPRSFEALAAAIPLEEWAGVG